MKVLHVANYFIPGATYQENMLLKHHSLDVRFDTCIISVSKNYPIDGGYEVLASAFPERSIQPGEYLEEGVVSIRLPASFEKRQRIWLKDLEHWVERTQPDVVLVHGATNLNTLRICWHKFRKKKRYRLIIDDHIPYSLLNKSLSSKLFYSCYRLFFAKFISAQADVLVPVSDDVEKVMKDCYGLSGRFVVIEHGADDNVFFVSQESRSQCRREYGIGNDDFLFCTTGKIIKEKRVDVLIELFCKLRKVHQHIKLLICGPGNPNYVSSLIANIPPEYRKSIIYVGNQTTSDLAAIYNGADVVVWADGVTMSSIEAGMCGLPAIMRNLPVNAERVQHGKGGFLFNTDDQLFRYMEKLVTDMPLRHSMARQRMEFSSNFSWKSAAEKFSEVFLNYASKQSDKS